VYWTLAYEFVWYALVAAWLVRATVAQGQRLLWGLTGLSLALWLVLLAGEEKLGQIGQFLPYFILGAQLYLLSRFGAAAEVRAGGWWCFAANAALIAVSVWFRAVGGLVHPPHAIPCDPWIGLAIVGVGIALMVPAAYGRLRLGGPLIGALGASTYPLYLMHDRAGVVLAQHVPWLRGLPGLALLLAFLVAVAALFARYVEPALISAVRSGLRRACGVVPPGRKNTVAAGPAPDSTPVAAGAGA
jgi:peptidoglycan/LPS O-acetylase OafA/YrhL